jgi:hypothetical protein
MHIRRHFTVEDVHTRHPFKNAASEIHNPTVPRFQPERHRATAGWSRRKPATLAQKYF